jgi:hypothetical protein
MDLAKLESTEPELSNAQDRRERLGRLVAILQLSD